MNNKKLMLTAASIFYYIVAPILLINSDIEMHGYFGNISYSKISESIFFNIFLSFIILYIYLYSAKPIYIHLLPNTNFGLYFIVISIILIFTYFPFCFEALNIYISRGEIDRNQGALLWLQFLNNPLASYAITLGILFSYFAIHNKCWWFLLLILIILIIELLTGMRSNFTRLLVVIFLLFNMDKKITILLIISIIFLIFNRQIFSGYELQISHLFGESLNIMYGHHQLLEYDLIDSCNSVYSLTRILTPPFLRSYTYPFSGDLVICINESYYSTPGLGYSILNDIIFFPVSLFLSIILLFICRRFLSKNITGALFTLLIASMLPQVLRLGFITSISYIISFIIWIMFPLVIFINTINLLINKK